MLLLFFAEQGATAPVGNNGGITLAQSFPTWTSTAWFGGKKLGSFSRDRMGDAYQAAITVLTSYWVNVFYDKDPDN